MTMQNRFPVRQVAQGRRDLKKMLLLVIVIAASGCRSSDPDDPENDPLDKQIPSAGAPYQRIKRSAPRQAAVRMQHANYLKQIGLAIHTFHTIYGQLPVGESPRENYPIKYRDGNPLLSWRVHLLPFLEHDPLYAKFKLDEPWDSPHNIQLLDEIPDTYKSLDYQGLGNKTIVLGLSGEGAVFNPDKALGFRDITDGTTQTILAIMAGPDKAVSWTQPVDLHCDMANLAQSLGDVGDSFLALFADGSVQRIRTGTDPKTLVQLFQYNDGEKIDFDKMFR